MKSFASAGLIVAALIAPALAQDGAPPPGGIQGASTEIGYDEVGYAEAARGTAGQAVTSYALSNALQPGTYVEVTALATGKTIILEVAGPARGGSLIDISVPAGRQLGFDGRVPTGVRVRQVTPAPNELATLRAGGAAPERLDAPDVLLVALRKKLPAGGPPAAAMAGGSVPSSSGPGASYAPPGGPPRGAIAPATGRFTVQVAALSNGARAQALASQLGGFVRPGSNVFRVQIGPFANRSDAEAARADAARRGYGDATIIAN